MEGAGEQSRRTGIAEERFGRVVGMGWGGMGWDEGVYGGVDGLGQQVPLVGAGSDRVLGQNRIETEIGRR